MPGHSLLAAAAQVDEKVFSPESTQNLTSSRELNLHLPRVKIIDEICRKWAYTFVHVASS